MLLLFTTWPNRNIFLASETKRQEKKNNHHKNFIHIFSHSLFDPSNNLLFLAQTKLKSSFENRWGIEKLNIRQMASSCRGKKKTTQKHIHLQTHTQYGSNTIFSYNYKISFASPVEIPCATYTIYRKVP